MRHYLLTRSAYGPDVPLDVNRRRLELLRGITVRSLASQTTRDVTWLVMVDHDDPYLASRMDAFGESGLPVIYAPAGRLVRDHRFDRPWAAWSKYLVRDGPTLTTRIDDDDAFAPWTLERFRQRSEQWALTLRGRRRVVWTMPHGVRVNGGRYNLREDWKNQFTSLYAPLNDTTTVMDINHTSVNKLARLRAIETPPAWLWNRHELARSSHSGATMKDIDDMIPVDAAVRSAFDIDWALV